MGKKKKVNYRDIFDVQQNLRASIASYDIQTIPITPVYGEIAKKLCELLGVCCLQADGEAETLCAYLCINGSVNGVVSNDTDVLAYGTPLLLSRIDVGRQCVTAIRHEKLCSTLDFDVSTFRDLCILLSCDYNERVKGMIPTRECTHHKEHKVHYKKSAGVGEKGAVCMISAYKTLEEVETVVDDMDPLIYRRCRELFTTPRKIEGATVTSPKKVQKANLFDYLDELGATKWMKTVEEAWRPIELVFHEDEDEDVETEGSGAEVADDEDEDVFA